MFPLNSNTPYIKDTGERARLGQIVGGSDTPELPDYGIADAGKVLTVGDDGSLEWDTKGAGGGDVFINYDFAKWSTGQWGTATCSADGLVFDNATDVAPIFALAGTGSSYNITDFTLYLDITSMHLNNTATSHQRFLMGDTSNGFIYEKTNHVWAFYAGSWYYTELTDPDLFNDCTVKLYVDTDKYWYIYKNNVLVAECKHALSVSNLTIGASDQGLTNALIAGARIYRGNYTE